MKGVFVSDLDDLANAVNARSDPRIYRRQKSRSVPVIVAVAFGFAAILIIAVGLQQNRSSVTPSPLSGRTATPEEMRHAVEIRHYYDSLQKDGTIYSIDWDRKIMRIDPLVWARMKVDQKKNLLNGFLGYYTGWHPSESAWVRVMSDRNDDVLGENSTYSGRIIH